MKQTIISISGHDIKRIMYRGEPVVTFAMIDKIHERPTGTAGRSFRENRGRFIKDEDFILAPYDFLSCDEICPAGNRKDIILITRRGYLKITKSLRDDKAWEVFNQMMDAYFIALEARKASDEIPFSEPFTFSAEPLNAMHARISFIREARHLFGAPKARKLWAMAGFPTMAEEEPVERPRYSKEQNAKMCLEHLLSANLQGHIVMDLIKEGDGSANSRLAKAGIRVLDDGGIAVASAARMVAPIFAHSKWMNGGHRNALLALDGAFNWKNMRFYDQCAKTIYLPAELLIAEMA